MKAIENLMSEHRQFERVLDALEAFAEDARRNARTDKEELGRFVTFFCEFTDTGHHGKEEGVLFQAMADGGFPNEDGPIGAMLAEHEQGRGFVAILRERAQQSAPWGESELRQIHEATRAFSVLLRDHIQKEDEILYPMAEGHLSAEARQGVDEACARFDGSRMQSGDTPRLQALGEELVARHASQARRLSDQVNSLSP